MTTITTKLHTYSFNLENYAERVKYEALCKRLKRDHKCFRANGSPSSAPEAGSVKLEIEHLFADQWNTSTLRLFDWYEAIYPNGLIKEGYYLKITAEMRDLRRTTRKCGFCGAMYLNGDGGEFCDRCLDSPSLKQDELRLLRLLPIEQLHQPKYPELTEAERKVLLPLYVTRQTTGQDSRNALKLQGQRETIETDRKKQISNANTKADGLLWLMDNGISIENVIYYDHQRIFCFGWRAPLSDDVASTLINKLADFPFTYEIKRGQG